MRIGQLARASGFPAKTIRYYEALGLLPEPSREASGYRSYESSQLRRLELIRLAKTAGLSLAEIADILSAGTGPGVDCAHAVGLLTEKLKQVRLQIIELQQLEAALEHTIEAHRRDELPASVSPDDCPVIERAARERARAMEELPAR
jgi:DNA-binding transcriptional MerR regulator